MRKRSRMDIQLSLTILQNDIRFVLKTRNLSLKGLLADYQRDLAHIEPCEMIIHLSSGLEISITGIVVPATPERGMAVDFVRMEEDSFYCLLHLIRLYSPDPDQVDRELLIPAFDRAVLEQLNNTSRRG